jgi:hypothetical protein
MRFFKKFLFFHTRTTGEFKVLNSVLYVDSGSGGGNRGQALGSSSDTMEVEECRGSCGMEDVEEEGEILASYVSFKKCRGFLPEGSKGKITYPKQILG